MSKITFLVAYCWCNDESGLDCNSGQFCTAAVCLCRAFVYICCIPGSAFLGKEAAKEGRVVLQKNGGGGVLSNMIHCACSGLSHICEWINDHSKNHSYT